MAKEAGSSVTSSHGMKQHQSFGFDAEVDSNIMDWNVTKVRTNAKADPQLINLKGTEVSNSQNNDICIYCVDSHSAKSLPGAMRHVE
jgi:hypothetical protein